MVIIEFCGVPGCGKSTTVDKLKDILLKKSTKVIDRKYLDREYLSNNVNINYYLSLLSIKQKRNIKNVMMCLEKYSDNYYYKKAALLLLALNKNKSDNFVCVLDEGFIQYLSSIFFDEEIDKEIDVSDFFEYIKECFDWRIIHCECDVATAGNRIMSRNRTGDRYLNNSPELQVKLLKMKQDNISFLLTKVPGLVTNIDTNSFVEDKVLEKIIMDLN